MEGRASHCLDIRPAEALVDAERGRTLFPRGLWGRVRFERFCAALEVFSSLQAAACALRLATAGPLPVLLTTQRPETGQNGRQLLPSAEATQWE